jgi:dynamin family protein
MSQFDDQLGTLHEDVLRCLGRIAALFDNAELLGINWSGDKAQTARAAKRMREHAESVRRLELVMPIVAPMKAGKSTLINAIIGYPLLPARANPMTTLPTRIKLVDGLDLDQPELALADSTIALFNHVGDELQRRIRQTGWKVPEAHSYLAELADLISSGQAEPLRSAYRGAAAIRETLMRLNDQLRLAALATGESYAGEIFELPEISTGHRAALTGGSTVAGQLVIVDTPGPNEHAMAAHLGPTLEDQLRSSHVVLVVLDYTQMGADAADEIRARVVRQLRIITSSKLIAVVNKVDERKKPEDLSEGQTKAAVCAALGLAPEQASGQIFETVARWGLIGSQMLADIQRFGDSLIPEQSESAVALLKEVAPVHWERRLKHVDAAELEADAVDILAQSGLRELVSSAIARLKAGAAPNVIEAGILRYQDAVAQLNGMLALELKSAERGGEVVAKELGVLMGESKQLADYQAAMPDVPTLERRFQRELRDFLKVLKEQGRDIISLVQSSGQQPAAETEGSLLGEAFQMVYRHAKKTLFEGVLRGKSADDLYEFDTRAQAEQFIGSLTGQVTEDLRELLDYARQEVDVQARRLAAEVVAEQEGKVRGLVDRAAAKLSIAFDVVLQVPPPAIVDGELAVELADPSVRSWSTQETYTTTERHRAWYKAWLGYHDVTVTKTRPVSHSRYQVSRKEVAGQLTAAFDRHLAEIAKSLDTYVATEVTDRLTAYYASLRGYLESYRAALARSQDSCMQDEATAAARKHDLTTLSGHVAAEQRKLADYLLRLADYARTGQDNAAQALPSPAALCRLKPIGTGRRRPSAWTGYWTHPPSRRARRRRWRPSRSGRWPPPPGPPLTRPPGRPRWPVCAAWGTSSGVGRTSWKPP